LNRYRNSNRFILILGIILILSLFMFACSGNTTQQAEPETQSESKSEEEYQVALPAVGKSDSTGNETDSSTADQTYPAPENQPSVGAAPSSDEAYPVPEEPVEAPAPIVRTELEATDPAMVSLASGDIQFVEFFAFW
jgi:hypothetical protein